MVRRPGRVIGTLAVVVTLGLGYAAADAIDAVPGVLTISPAPPAAQQPAAISAQAAPVPTIPAYRSDGALPDLDTAHVQALVDVTKSYFGDDFARELTREEGIDPRVGISVIDVASQKVVAEYQGQRALTPASSTKVVTAAVALHTLGPDAQFPTRVAVADNALYLIGGGDVLLGADESDPLAINGRVGLKTLAEQAAQELKARGVTEVTVAVDVSLFQTRQYAPGTDAGDDKWTMPASPIAVNANRGQRAGSHLDRPAERAGEKFAEHLQAAGITITSQRIAQAPASAEDIASGQSAPLRDIVAEMLRPSDNAIAETLGLLSAHAQGRTADFSSIQPTMDHALTEMGIPTEGFSVVNSSGLARANVISPRLLATIMARAAHSQGDELVSIIKGVPVGGLDGTLHDRQLAIAGQVRAKTGTLLSVVSLTGVVRTADGHLLAFSIVADQLPPGGVFEARNRVDEFAQNLAQCACALPADK